MFRILLISFSPSLHSRFIVLLNFNSLSLHFTIPKNISTGWNWGVYAGKKHIFAVISSNFILTWFVLWYAALSKIIENLQFSKYFFEARYFIKLCKNSSKTFDVVFQFEILIKYEPFEIIAAIILILFWYFWLYNSQSFPFLDQLYRLNCLMVDNAFVDWDKIISLFCNFRKFYDKISPCQ